MEIFHIRILITIIATIVAIDSAILVYILPNHSGIILTIEVILLPVLYIIGNYYVEEILKKQYEEDISIIEKEANDLKDKYLKQKYLNEVLKRGRK
jgi:hypothetical protein